MTVRRFRPWGVLALALSAAAFSGCAAESENDDGAESSADALKYNVDSLMSDEEMFGNPGVTAATVQLFLEQKGSALASYEDPEEGSAAEIIFDAAEANGINPVYLLARIQGESGLIQRKTLKNLAKATGCGCPDGGECAKKHAGFSRQINCTAELHQAYVSEIEQKGRTRSGWAVGKSKKTLDPCNVTPSNVATAVLYTYTPWVGSGGAGCGSSGTGGSTLMVQIYQKYKRDFPAAPQVKPEVAAPRQESRPPAEVISI